MIEMKKPTTDKKYPDKTTLAYKARGLEIRSRFEIDRHRAQARPLVPDVPLYPFVGNGAGTDSQIVSGLEVPPQNCFRKCRIATSLTFTSPESEGFQPSPKRTVTKPDNSLIYESSRYTAYAVSTSDQSSI